MNLSNKLLSDLVIYRTYPKLLKHLSRKETFEETINRCLTMHLDKFPKLSKDIMKSFSLVHDRKVMPSMRSLQFGGEGVKKNNLRLFNCSYLPIDDVRAFGEIIFLLLSGCGVGFSVEQKNIKNLPSLKMPRQEGHFVVQDSIAGWAQALDTLMEAYFFCRVRPLFDFSNISPKGSLLNTTGAKAPGPKPLVDMLTHVESKLKNAVGRKLASIEIHDIVCIISDCVIAGGVRRSALISFFDKTDNEMISSKTGTWWEKHPYRARSNNSVVLYRSDTTYEEFHFIYTKCKESKAGEPGIFWTDDEWQRSQPCAEISLLPNQMCNTTTFSVSDVVDKKDFLQRVYSATVLGSLQATYTDFPYVREKWKEVTEKGALLGVSFTGIGDNPKLIKNEWLKEGAELVLEVNEKFAKKLGINLADRTTCNKPDGSSACVFGGPSGVHTRFSKPYYIRRIRISKNEALATYLSAVIPELVEDDKFAANTVVVSIPQESPPNSISREDESALSFFGRILDYNKYWIAPGHRVGNNKHNVSCTINVKDNEWDSLEQELWNSRYEYAAVSLLPFDGGTYQQAPFEVCDKEKFDNMSKLVTEIDLTKIMEIEDSNLIENWACGAGGCEIK